MSPLVQCLDHLSTRIPSINRLLNKRDDCLKVRIKCLVYGVSSALLFILFGEFFDLNGSPTELKKLFLNTSSVFDIGL